jgi:A/G-specific adenine glycosylase
MKMTAKATKKPTILSADFAPRLLQWFDQHGRHDLPWQTPRTPYRVWVSEIMLQQTQVSTVIPYFEKFMLRFPDLSSLASASQDDVLALWTGLGYYSRARNLHRCAQRCVEQFQSQLPQTLDELCGLPGIGRSTAGAILAQAHNQAVPILDGNVKRVLTRLYGIQEFPGSPAIEKKLWQLSEDLLPNERLVDYTQAIMDFGATLCVRSKPRCMLCPFNNTCVAYREQLTVQIPARKPKREYPIKACFMLLAINKQKQIWLEKRPSTGVWAGLWCLPQYTDMQEVQRAQQTHFQQHENSSQLPVIEHGFSHYQLNITPIVLNAAQSKAQINDNSQTRWQSLQELDAIGLPAPIKKLLETLP